MGKHSGEKQQNKSKRSLWARFALAGVATVGIGAALTTAAWTDNVWFSANADTQVFDLRGSDVLETQDANWEQGDAEGNAIAFAVDPAAFDNMIPGGEYTANLYVKNFSGNDAAVSFEATTDGALFTSAGNGLEVTTTVNDEGKVLEPGEVATVTVTVVASDDLSQDAAGKAGNIVITAKGSTEINN